MGTSEGPSTDGSGDSRSHQWRLVVDGNVAYHLTYNTGKSWKIQKKVRASGFEPGWVASHWTVLPLDYKPNRIKILVVCRILGFCQIEQAWSTGQFYAWPNKVLHTTIGPSEFFLWVNWICVIIISMFLKNAITIQLTMPVPLQFCASLNNAIMYASSCMWPTCRHTGGGHTFVWTKLPLLIPCLSFH
jgi:hypothetical protein